MSDRSQSAKAFANKRNMIGQRMYWPVIGVITGVRYADDPENQSRLALDSVTGAMLEASVLVIDDGTDGGCFFSSRSIPSAIRFRRGSIAEGGSKFGSFSSMSGTLLRLQTDQLFLRLNTWKSPRRQILNRLAIRPLRVQVECYQIALFLETGHCSTPCFAQHPGPASDLLPFPDRIGNLL